MSLFNYNKLLSASVFAADKHRDQRRKDQYCTPYIRHPLGVAHILTEIGKVEDVDILVAALLHDTVEDTDTTFEEIEKRFGRRVRDIVAEVTDDTSLDTDMKKRAQVEHVARMSDEAKLVKMADKLYNMCDLLNSVPASWSELKVRGFYVWSKKVVGQISGLNPNLEAAIAEMWDKEITLAGDNSSVTTIPRDVDLDEYLEKYYEECRPIKY